MGKSGQGISTALEANRRVDAKAGLGFDDKLKELGIIPQKHKYVAEKPSIKAKFYECPKLSNKYLENVTIDKLSNDWFNLQSKQNKVGEVWYDDFCSVKLQKELFQSKSLFDPIGNSIEFREARNKANPFEAIKSEMFQNRAAIKICEIDRCLNFAITQPNNCMTYQKERKTLHDKLLKEWKERIIDEISIHDARMWTTECIYFADICAGPGGFSEYFLHSHTWQSRGFGFTLRGNEDFKLSKFNINAPTDTFSRFYGRRMFVFVFLVP